MKKSFNAFWVSAAAAIMLNSCAGHHYEVSGFWESGIGNTVYLSQEVAGFADSLSVIDSVAVSPDGTFSMSGKLEYPQKMVFSFGDKTRAIFAGETPVKIEIADKTDSTGKKTAGYSCDIEAGREQKVLADGSSFGLSNSLLELGTMFMLSKAYDTGNQEHIDSITTGIKEMKEAFNQSIRKYLDTTRDDVASTYFIRDFMLKNRPIGEATACYDSLSANVKASPLGKNLLAQIELASRTNVGGIPDDFSLPAPDGDTLSLSGFKGHYVILDFWASWCSPCLKEMPNVKAIYEKHHGDGLEILGVSLDEDAAAWKTSIEENGLSWNHVSSLKGWGCPVAKQFNVTGIPRMFILDPQGRIIAQDLRGEALSGKIDEIYGE